MYVSDKNFPRKIVSARKLALLCYLHQKLDLFHILPPTNMEYHVENSCIDVIPYTYTGVHHLISWHIQNYQPISDRRRPTERCMSLSLVVECSPEDGILNRYFRRYKDMTISEINSLNIERLGVLDDLEECLPLLFLSNVFGLFMPFERNGTGQNCQRYNEIKFLNYGVEFCR